MKKNSNQDEPKRGRGRPRLSADEKARRLAERLRKKKVKSKSKRKILNVATIKKEIETSTKANKLILSDSVEAAITLEEAKPPVENITNLTFDDLSEDWLNKISNLTTRIEELEIENVQNRKELKKMQSLSEKWMVERNLIRELIKMEQDSICANEELLPIIDLREFRYAAERATWLRTLFHNFFRQPDELILAKEIKELEINLQNRRRLLILVNSELADVFITILGKKDTIEIIEESVIKFREIRINLGRDFRFIRDRYKDAEISLDDSKIISTLNNNINIINNVGENLKKVMYESQIGVQNMFQRFDGMQKQLLKNNEFQTAEQIEDFDKKVNNIFNNPNKY